MRYESTFGDGFIIDAPHRMISTLDLASIGPSSNMSEPVIAEPEPARGPETDISPLAKRLAKEMLGRWYADSVLND